MSPPASKRERTNPAVSLELVRKLGPSKVLIGDEPCAPFRADASEAEPGKPAAVVLAESTDDIQKTLEVAEDTRTPVVLRAGGTGKAGGATAIDGCVVLSTLKLSRIKEIDERELLAVVEPGVLLADFQAALVGRGVFYPPDPNSAVGCALGGNVATNAGGPRAFKYGVTGRYVLGLDAFLMGGQRMSVGRRTAKGVTGYDVTSLLVGSEGTLAAFGDITLRLLPAPQVRLTLLASYARFSEALSAVASLVAAGSPATSIELLDLRLLPANAQALWQRAGRSACAAALLIEVDGDERPATEQAARVAAACQSLGASDVVFADPRGEDRTLWELRAGMSAALRALSRYKLSEDVAIPRQVLPAFGRELELIGERNRVRVVAYGHAGDGNFHVNFLWDSPSELPRVQQAIRQLFELTVSLRGTLSGEHGIGVLKAPFLSLEQSTSLIGLQVAIRRGFDPHGLFNPGKVLPPALREDQP